MEIRHTGIMVDNMEKAVSFYQDLGFRLIYQQIELWEGLGFMIVKMQAGTGPLLELVKTCPHWPRHHVALTVDSLEEATTKALSHGGTFRGKSKEDHKVAVQFVTDPSGNLVELVGERHDRHYNHCGDRN